VKVYLPELGFLGNVACWPWRVGQQPRSRKPPGVVVRRALTALRLALTLLCALVVCSWLVLLGAVYGCSGDYARSSAGLYLELSRRADPRARNSLRSYTAIL